MARQISSPVAQLATALVAVVAAFGLTDLATMPRRASGGLAVLEEPSLREHVLRSSGGTYIAQLLAERDSTLARWPARVEEPIRVWIEPHSIIGFTDHVKSAFAEWTDIGLPVRFTFVERAREAEIQVRWTDRLERKTGNTVWRVDRNGWMRGSDVVLSTHLSDGRALDVRSLRAIALHEVGHALGLSHSDDRHDVMAPLVRVAALSNGDRATARLLYTLPAGHLR